MCIRDRGVLLDNGFQRGTASIRSEFKVSDRITIGENLNATYSYNNGGNGEAFLNANRLSPLVPVYDDEGGFGGTYSPALGLGNTRNPVAQLRRAKDNYYKSLRVFGNAYAQIQILDGLSFRSNIGLTAQSGTGRNFQMLDPEHSEPLSTNTLSMQSDYNYELSLIHI